MNKLQASAWVNELTQLLTGKKLISVSIGPGDQIDIRQNQKFNKAYFVEYNNGDCVIALSDTYGVITSAETWSIDPDKRMVYAETTDGAGEVLRFAWAIVDNDGDGIIYHAMRYAQQRLRRIPD